MYAGALDERLKAVVPVCSVGTYQAYLRAACCVCEVLPGALRFCEEGDVLGLVAPRALLVINATRDAFQFSVDQAKLSIARARPIFELHKAGDKLRHETFESPHAYNQPMRDVMYGWMTRWLKSEGEGKPIPEPQHDLEKAEDLACFTDGRRPKGFLVPPTLAQREGQTILARPENRPPDHVEDWESTAAAKRTHLQRVVFGPTPPLPRRNVKPGKTTTAGGIDTTPLLLHPEPNMPVPVLLQRRAGRKEADPACILLHLDGKGEALKHPLAAALLERNWLVAAPDLRATGETRPQNDAIAGAADHNSAEHALWIGRPLLGQWVFDVRCLLDFLGGQANVNRERIAVVGLGQAGVVALCAAALEPESVHAAAALSTPASFLTGQAYPQGTRMGLLPPGIVRAGDIPLLAALVAPRRLVIAEGLGAEGKPLDDKPLAEAFAVTRAIYRLHKSDARLTLAARLRPADIAARLAV
jgi:pimeloyl-ACP methyl ester carboxylesterase